MQLQHHRACRQTPQHSNQDSPSLHASHEHPVRRGPRRPSRTQPISRPEHTRTSTTVTMNAPSVPRRSRGSRGAFGHAEHAGPCFTLDALRNGPQTRARPLPASKRKMARHRLRDNGDVPDATCPRTPYPRTSIAGVRKNWIPRPCQDCHPSLVVRHALGLACYQRAVHIHAQSLAMQGPVHLAV
jgi:hypothetical protein